MPTETYTATNWIDGTLYPDEKPPIDLPFADRVDFLARLSFVTPLAWPAAIVMLGPAIASHQ